jgi:citrate synthase
MLTGHYQHVNMDAGRGPPMEAAGRAGQRRRLTMSVAGLDGVVVAETVLSEVDGEAGKLIVRGLPVEALAGQVAFEEMACRLWEGLAPPPAPPLPPPPRATATAAAVRAALGRGRLAAFRHVEGLRRSAAGLPPVSALRLGLASLRPGGGAGAVELESAPDENLGGDHLLATAAIPVFAAAFERARRGLPAVPPEPALAHAADFLRMLRGEPASDAEAAALDAYLVTVAEHGMNASTFTARVVASTRAGVLPAVIAALCALEGPLHGGAPGPVLEMLDALRGRPDVAGWLAAELAAGRRLMGFGHRIYRVRDPRADVLKAQVAKLRAAAERAPGGVAGGAASGVAGDAAGADDAGGRLALAERVEREALAALRELRPGKRIDTNVEFYTAVLLDALRIDRGLFTSVFAAGRVAGWTAHVFEQERANRLIRPQSAYVGPRPETCQVRSECVPP